MLSRVLYTLLYTAILHNSDICGDSYSSCNTVLFFKTANKAIANPNDSVLFKNSTSRKRILGSKIRCMDSIKSFKRINHSTSIPGVSCEKGMNSSLRYSSKVTRFPSALQC